MRKKLLGGLLVVAIAAVAAFNVSMNTQESELSLLALANVEALAQNEGGGSSITITCYNNYNSCWFWNCTNIYRCNLNQCYDVSSDSHSGMSYCVK